MEIFKSNLFLFRIAAKVLINCIAGFLCHYTYSQQVTIVKSNLPQAAIIIPLRASKQIKDAANALQTNIYKSTNASLPVTTKIKNGVNNIHIGNTAYVLSLNLNTANVDEDGFFLMTIDKNNFIIAGGSDWGTEFGVNFFLENYMGIMSLFPTDLGMNIPARSSFDIPFINKMENPAYLSRQFAPGTTAKENQLGAWERFNRLRGRIQFHHNLWKLFDPKEYYKSNPGFYADYVTAMPTGVRWQPNFSAPGIIDSASQKIIRFFEENPNAWSYSLGVNDIPKYDHSPASLKRRNGKTNYLGLEDVSNDYFLWANAVVKRVKERYPDKLFGLLASNSIATPPSDSIGIDPNMVPFLTYERLRWSDSTQKEQGHQLTLAWAKQSKNIGWYDYTYGLNYLLPRVWFHEMRDYLQWGNLNHVKYYYAEVYPNWGEGPKAWIQSKLLWNPDYDVDSLLNVWYANTAGNKAAPNLKAYYSIWEIFWTKDILSSDWKNKKKQYLPKDNYSYLDIVPEDYIERSDRLLDAAYTLAETDLQKQRVQKILEMWQIYKTAVRTWQGSHLPPNRKVQELKTNKTFVSLLNNLQPDSLHSGSIRNIKAKLKIE